MSTTHRPRTSKPRGPCQYYDSPRGCFAGNNCKFLHGEPHSDGLTPYDRAKRCRFYAQGFCKRGDACWFIHASETKSDDEEEELCSICFEKPSTYGLLGGCSHIFCTICIKQWRDPTNKPGGVLDSGNTKKCPMCRASSKFITPSSRFWKHGTQEKDRVVQAYKDSMARVPCRYFQKSLQKNKDKPLCPYGKDCFYQHLNPDGTPHIFKDGVDASMRKFRSNFPLRGGLSFSFGSDDIHFMPFTSLLDTMTIPIPLPNARSPSRRDRQRHVIDNFLRMQPRPGPSGTQPGTTQTQTQVDAQTQTSNRLREVSRSLDMLHEAIGENGSSLEHLSDAVEALRAGLGGLEAGARLRGALRDGAEVDRWLGGGWDDPTGGDAEAARQEDVVMERLEEIADQMLASIDALQRESRNNAPAPRRSDDDDDDVSGMPSLERIPNSDSEDDDSDMPHLESVSNTSESESDDDDDDFGLHGDSDGEVWPWQRPLRRFVRRPQRRAFGANANRNNGTSAQAPPPTATASSSGNVNEDAIPDAAAGLTTTTSSSAPLTTSTTPSVPPTTPTTESDTAPLPQLIRIPSSSSQVSPHEASGASPSPSPAVAVEAEAEASSSRTSLITPSPSVVPEREPPFVTDGRGRVVWTSSSDDGSLSSSSSSSSSTSSVSACVETQSRGVEAAEKTDSGASHEPQVGSGAASTTGCLDSGTQLPVPRTEGAAAASVNANVGGHGRRSGGNTLVDWFNSLF